MKQITSPKYIYKIKSDRLADSNYDLTLKEDNVEMEQGNVIALADNQVFRFLDEICKLDIKHNIKHDKEISKHCYKDKLIEVVFTSNSHFEKACEGFKVNGKKYKRLLGTTGGVKKNTVIFCNEKYYNRLYKKLECSRNKKVKLVPSKLEAYMALAFSNSIEVTQPKKIAVLPDAITSVTEKIIYIDDKADTENPPLEPIVEFDKEYTNEVNISDGCGLVDIELLKTWSKETQPIRLDKNGNDITPMLGGCCLRNAYVKGMVYPFDYKRWIDEYNNGNSICKDVWGNNVDLKECDLILTESMLKLWNCYKDIDDYLEKTTKHGFKFSVCKIVEEKIDDRRRLNYQYLQSFNLTDDDIKELAKETVDNIKNSMGRDYAETLKFLGVKEGLTKEQMIKSNHGKFSYVDALSINKEMLNDKMVIKTLNKLLKKKANEAKIGKLYVDGNYQIASGDPVCILERAFSKEIKGFLKKKQFFSTYWYDKGVDEVLIMRSPMTCHNNIVKGEIVLNEELYSWYKYMKNVLIFNAHDNTMSAENGEDFDGDTNFTTNNAILLKRYKEEPTTICVQYKPKKYIVTEEMLMTSNMKGFNNSVGSITNTATAMYDILSQFDKDSEEYKTLHTRILCTQLYQQGSLDSIKGCPITYMNKEWTNPMTLKVKVDKKTGEILDSEDEINRKAFYKKLVTDKKPYFMIYIYPKLNAQYNKNIKKANEFCLWKESIRGNNINDVLLIEDKNADEQYICEKYLEGICVTDLASTMNRICHMMEEEFDNCKNEIIESKNVFNKDILKCGVEYTDVEENLIKEIYEDYLIASYNKAKIENKERNDNYEFVSFRENFIDKYRNRIKETKLSKEVVCDILIDLTYKKNKSIQFLWDISGETIIDNLFKAKGDNK